MQISENVAETFLNVPMWNWLEETIRLKAARRRMSRAAWMREAALEKLAKEEREQLEANDAVSN